MEARTLYASIKHIKRAARDKNYCEALAFALLIKASHTNSMLLNYSWRRIMSLCSCNLPKAKQLRDDAMDYGLIDLTASGGHIVAKKLHTPNKKNEKCAKFFIYNNTYITYIEGGATNRKQTIKEISDLIMCAAIAYNIDGYNRKLNTWQARAKELRMQNLTKDLSNGNSICNKRYDVDERGITVTLPSERGYSHKKMLEKIFNNSIGLSKLKSLLTKMKTLGVLTIKKNVVHFRNIKYEECWEYDMFCPIVNDETGQRRYRYAYRKKVESKKERDGEYTIMYRRMGNSYKCKNHIIISKRSNRRHTKRQFEPKTETPCCTLSLPF